MTTINRRDLGKLSLGGIAAAGIGTATGSQAIPGVASATDNTPHSAHVTGIANRPADLPAAKGHRVVVVGGGWSGMTIAKYLKVNDPELDVVLIERRAVFISHPISGAWLAGLMPMEPLMRSYLDAAAANNYIFFNASLIDLDRAQRKVYTDQGWLAYDDLVLAPGLDYDYGTFGVDDPTAVNDLKTRYPAGFMSASEHISLNAKVRNFKGGTFVLTAPPGIFRCSATPYERACLIASVFKREKIAGKVVLIDPREEPAVKAEGFLAAFDELHSDTIEYMSSTEIESIDPETRTIVTGFDDIVFDDAAIYPRIRGARLLEYLGLVDPASAQKEAAIDRFAYNATPGGVMDEHVYLAGDCRPMPFSKSGNTAYTEGKYLAALIAARAKGSTVAWESPQTICYSIVGIEPMAGIMVRTKYKYDATADNWDYEDNFAVHERDREKADKAFEWAETHLDDMFS
ncbi:MAG: FAD-dependent oxidoreductase [Rhodospirillaceae bacterium]|jgi:sulfide dehydrogenase [flavocytochrome c] flavoprotein chain|nr:FAD-dependent oxidoreductase [Rhodospirillaceae bacterium]MBT6406776.1 FAD-dependent oxidoreductase [Rhodospirillaceae bacterium]